MDRRSFLAAASLLLAGCNEVLPSDDTPTSTSSATPTATPTAAPTATPTATSSPTQTDTPTSTPTETSTPEETRTRTLSPLEEQAARDIRRAIAAMDQAVETYVGSKGDSVVDVNAASTAFSRVSVVAELSEVDDHYIAARRHANSQQLQTVNAVADAREFLLLAAEIQERVIAAYQETRDAESDLNVERESAVSDRIETVRSRTNQAVSRLSRIRTETNASSFEVIPSLPVSDYEAKIAQFTAETEGFEVLLVHLETFLTAIGLINDAERFARQGTKRRARDEATKAAELLEPLAVDLQEFVDGLDEAGASLEALGTDLAALATTKAEKARTIVRRNR